MSRRRGSTAVAALLTTWGASCSSGFGMPPGATEQGEDISDLWRIFFIAAIIVAGIVYLLIGWSLIRYRRRRRDADDAVGRSFSANIPIEVAYTAVPVMIVVVLFVLSFRTEQRVDAVAPNPDVTLHAQAFSWGWRFTYEDSGLMIVSEPSGEGIPGPQIELPLGLTTRVVLTSNDVIHAFWVPAFLFKRDAIPGRTTQFDVTPTQEGTFRGVCAEFCGLNHAYMTFSVAVVDPTAFESWQAQQATLTPTPEAST